MLRLHQGLVTLKARPGWVRAVLQEEGTASSATGLRRRFAHQGTGFQIVFLGTSGSCPVGGGDTETGVEPGQASGETVPEARTGGQGRAEER